MKKKVILKKIVFSVLMTLGILMLLADGDSIKSILISKGVFFADVAIMCELWKRWNMDKHYDKILKD